MATTNNIPADWSDATVIEGFEIVDKSALVDIPFLITGLLKSKTTTGVDLYYIDGEKQNGEGFTFSDSSTGVKAQLQGLLTSMGKGDIAEEEYAELRVLAPRGLRVSEYEKKDAVTLKTYPAKTYYLTTNNKRRSEVKPSAAPKTRRTAS